MRKKKLIISILVLILLSPYTTINAIDNEEKIQSEEITQEEVNTNGEENIDNEENDNLQTDNNTVSNEEQKEADSNEITENSQNEESIDSKTEQEENENNIPVINYRVHVEDYGWEESWLSNGTTSGTTGESKRLEAIQINLDNSNYTGNIQYKAHIQDIGWERDWISNGEISGTTGKSKRLEAIQIRLTDELAEKFDVYYRVHSQDYGWLDWAKNGEKAGTQGYSLRLEAIQIVITNKGEVPGSTANPFIKKNLKYQSHVENYGWMNWVSDDTISGTTGQALRTEAVSISLVDPEYSGSIKYRGHVQNIGWQNWVSDGAVAGTTGKKLRLEAIQIELTGQMAENYDIYYRCHVANFGWLDWASNGQSAGSAGWNHAIEAIEIKLVKKGEGISQATKNHFISNDWQATQLEESTIVEMNIEALQQLKDLNLVDKVQYVAKMNYGSKVTREIGIEKDIDSILTGDNQIDLTNYGKFNLTVNYIKNGNVINTSSKTVGIGASEYNLAPLSATFPVVYFSLSIWDINTNENGNIPTIVMLDRPSAYDWDNLPTNVYAMPYLTESEISYTSDFTAFKQYVKDLYEITPTAKFNLYINDITCSYIHDVIYSNKIPEGQYTITMLSDGSATYSIINDTYDVDNPEEKHQKLIETWNNAKEYAYKNGKKASGWDWHSHWDCMYAVLSCEPGTQWWVSRNNLFTSGDSNAFADKIKNDVTIVNVNTLLQNLQSKGDATVKEFKDLYNFNDGYFNSAEQQGKKAMMILGTYVYNEQNFDDYARLTQLYYGDEYMYYYKGHPNTPTGLYPEKQVQLNELEIEDVDSSIAAELILFFNPEISMSGYGTSTFNSASSEMACGLYNMNKETALSETQSVDYTGIDWFASSINENTKKEIRDLCESDDRSYLVEFSDQILGNEEYDIAIYNANKGTLKYYKLSDNGYTLVRTQTNNTLLSYRSHVSDYGWLSTVKNGQISGTVGESKALEAFTVNLGSLEGNGSIEYRSHVAGDGWQNWVNEGKVSGTEGKSKAIEAISIRLTGELADKYDIYYRVHSQDYGWLDWAKNGQDAGTTGLSKRAEAIEIQIVEKGDKAPGSTDKSIINK